MADRQLAVAALLALADEVLLPDGRAIGRDAIGRRATAVRVRDHGSAALRTVLGSPLDGAHLRKRMVVPACGIPVTAEEAGPPPGADDREVPFLAHVALPDVVLFPEGGLDLLADRLPVRLERLEDLAEDLLGFPDDVFAGTDPRRYPFHVGFETGRHVGLRNPLRVVLQGPDDGATTRRGPRVLPLDELAIVELLDDLVAGRLGPETKPLHFLNQGSLAVSRRRLRPVFVQRDGPHAVEGLLDDERREDRFP